MPATILVIEDQPDIRRLIRMTLEFDDYVVEEAGDGAAGLAAARRLKPDVVLLDVMMPGMTGLEVAAAFAADPALAATPLVMISALGTEGQRQAGLAAGARDYLVKPFSPWQLLERVQQLTGTQAAAA